MGTSASGCACCGSETRAHELVVSSEVSNALKSGRPVVALESTIISHGMPYPQNLKTALEVEQVVRQHGAVPATIAIIGGKCCIGCSPSQLEHIARAGTAVAKVSRRDLPAVLASGKDGATTVSGTMLLAARAGIRVFVTGMCWIKLVFLDSAAWMRYAVTWKQGSTHERCA